MPDSPYLCQVAFSVTNLKRTHGFYQQLFGFRPAGGTEDFRGPVASMVQGLPDAASVCWWLVGAQDFLQLEMFQFESPPVRGLAADWRPCDVGYTTVGLLVADFEAVLDGLEDAGVEPVAPPFGVPGARRVCIRDPEGVLVELMEDDPLAARPDSFVRPELGVAIRSVTLSVPDVAKAKRFWRDTLECAEVMDLTLHTPGHERVWGLAGAQRETVLLSAGEVLIELVQYTDPAGKPWPEGYQISDQGLLNVALGFRDKAEFDRVYGRIIDAGYTSNSEPIDFGSAAVVYMSDDQGFSVELLYCDPAMDAGLGFEPE